MNAFVAQFSVNDVDKGGADDFARQLLETWRSSRGLLCDEMQMLFSNLVLFDGIPTPNDTPDILFCGTDSLATKILGSGWADGPDKARLNLDATYRRLVGESYRMAAKETKPVFDMVSTPLRSDDPASRQLRYQRLILPLATHSGARFLVCYSFGHPAAKQVQDPLSIEKYPPCPGPQSVGHASPFGPAGLPT